MHTSLPHMLWSIEVVRAAQGICDACGSKADVRACYRTPPSLGGRNEVENGAALCAECRLVRTDTKRRVRVSLSIDEELYVRLALCAKGRGRSVSDILRQLAAEVTDTVPLTYPNGKPTTRVSAWLAQDIFDTLVGIVGDRRRVGGALATVVRDWVNVEVRKGVEHGRDDQER